MRVVIASAACLLLCACAHNDYSVAPGETPQVSMNDAIHDCSHKVLSDYAHGQAHTGALLFGAAGALADVDSGPMKAADIDPDIERCMKERGYVGTSEN